MLELNNVTKVYAAKGGASVRALDGVSVRFGEKGLVFLLGKSGSGKSTLLNVAGGRDRPTEGEIIVGDKRSSDFTPSDFDSYRNTYVGFVFQEYNLLDEFSVRENISLALELQGKAQARQDVDRILEEVDLSGYGSRRPNTLSGGQKQRVAIARALVKDPRIIMADEPTGALDSETGRQVFEMLKKLSRERLVIVVSHDREFAECYGDRIIELADGKIISDVTRSAGAEAEKPLHLRAGDALTGEQLARLKDLLTEGGELNIAEEQKGLSLSRKNAVKGTRGTFEKTGEIPPAAAQEKTMIRSRMPLKKAVKMGVKSMKTKPFRLAFTIFLSTVSFLLFGVISTLMLYDPVQAGINAVLVQQYQGFSILRGELVEHGESNGEIIYGYNICSFKEEELSALEQEIGLPLFGRVLGVIPMNIPTILSADCAMREFNGIVPMEEERLAEFDMKLVAGNYPEGANEVAVTLEAFETAKACGWLLIDENGNNAFDESGVKRFVSVDAYGDLIGQRQNFYIGGTNIGAVITGIIDCGEIPEEIAAYRADAKLNSFYSDYMNNSFHQCLFAASDFVERYEEAFGPLVRPDTTDLLDGRNDSSYAVRFSELAPYCDIVWTEGENDGLGPREALIDGERLYLLAADLKNEETLLFYDDFIEAFNRYTQGWEREDYRLVLDFVVDHYERVTGYPPLSLKSIFSERGGLVFSIAGVVTDSVYGGMKERTCLVSDAGYTALSDSGKLSRPKDLGRKYNSAIFFLSDRSNETMRKLFAAVDGESGEFINYSDSMVKKNVSYLSDTFDLISSVFLYVGIILALFSALLLFNFISATVSCKRREIGVLRAVGARGADVFRIFLSESAVVMVICFVLSCGLSAVLTSVINRNVVSGISAAAIFKAISFGSVNILIIMGISLVVAFLGTFLPVWREARKNPVESIRSI